VGNLLDGDAMTQDRCTAVFDEVECGLPKGADVHEYPCIFRDEGFCGTRACHPYKDTDDTSLRSVAVAKEERQ
jgi:hypothetical protein